MSTTNTKQQRGATELSRRSFLKWSAAVGAGAAVMGTLPGLFRTLTSAEAAEITDYAQGSWVKSGCNMCGGQCGIDCFVDAKGVLRKIEPTRDPNNVAGVSSFHDAQLKLTGDQYEFGTLCCKGNAGRRSLYDPDRLQSPMKRVGARGSASSFVPITWDQAILAVASKLANIRKTYGARAIFWFGEDHSFTHIQQDVCDGLGTPNYHNHAMLCDVSRKSAFRSVIGDERPLADLEGADFLLVFGWNFLSAIKWTWLAKAFSRGRRKADHKFVYVDPVFNTTASKADKWLQVKPGTDGALALALAHRIIAKGDYDTAFVQAATIGFDAFKAYLQNTAPWGDGTVKDAAWAAGITGIAQADIEALADDLGAAYKAGKKICIDSWSGPGHKGNATQGGRAVVALCALFGAIDKPGTMIFPERNGPGRLAKESGWPAYDGWRADGTKDITLTEAAVSNRNLIDATGKAWPAGTAIPKGTKFTRKYLYGHGSGSYVDALETMITQRDFLGIPYPAKAAVVVFQNLMMSVPEVERTRKALEAMEFVLVVDTHMSETAEMADIVIPGTSYLERFDFNARWVTFRAVNLRQPVVKPWIAGGRSETQFLMDVGGAIGIPGFKVKPERTVDELQNKKEWETFVAGYATAMTWDQLKASGLWVEDFAQPKRTTRRRRRRPPARASTRRRWRSRATVRRRDWSTSSRRSRTARCWATRRAPRRRPTTRRPGSGAPTAAASSCGTCASPPPTRGPSSPAGWT
jgi:thiosulfate reductase/polysulfide reductase chain A